MVQDCAVDQEDEALGRRGGVPGVPRLGVRGVSRPLTRLGGQELRTFLSFYLNNRPYFINERSPVATGGGGRGGESAHKIYTPPENSRKNLAATAAVLCLVCYSRALENSPELLLTMATVLFCIRGAASE